MNLTQRNRIINVALFILVLLIPRVWKFYPVITNALIVVITFWFFRSVRDIGLGRPTDIGKTIVYGFFLALGINLFSKIAIVPFVDFITGTERDLARFEHLRGNPVGLLKFLPYIWVSAAFGEEVVFRGFFHKQFPYIFKSFAYSEWAGAVLSATIFGLGHWYQGISGIVFTAIIGFIFSIVFIRSRYNLWLCILIHGFFDTISGIMYVLRWDIFFRNIW